MFVALIGVHVGSHKPHRSSKLSELLSLTAAIVVPGSVVAVLSEVLVVIIRRVIS